MIEFPRDFKEFLRLLTSKGIEYLVVGGYAVGYYGYPRATGDMDIWIAVGEENALKMVETLREFEFDVPELRKQLFLTRDKVVRMGVPPMRLEILTSIDGVDFESCYKNRVIEDIDGIMVNFISRQDLLINKRATGRLKDADDADKLCS